MVAIDRTFQSSYDVDVLTELPSGSAARFYFPGGSQAGGRDGLIIRFQPRHAEAWIGIFAFGDHTPSGVWTTPDAGMAGVVSAGAGYLVSADSPGTAADVAVTPVLGVFPSADNGVLVFHDYTNLAAYGVDGLRWLSKRVSWDGIAEIRFADGRIFGRGWSVPDESWAPFEIDLTTGEQRGGAAPPDLD